MPGANGLELATTLADGPAGGPEIVFVTAFEEHAAQAFELAAADYVLKPYSKARLYQAVDRAIERLRGRRGPLAPVDRFSVRHNDRVRYVPFSRVESVHANGKNIVIIVDGQEVPIATSLRSAAERLPQPPFWQVSRFAVVNLDYVVELEELFNDTAEMRMRSGRRVHVSRRGRRALRDWLER